MCSWRNAIPGPPRRGRRLDRLLEAGARSGSSAPSPRRGRVDERGGSRSAVELERGRGLRQLVAVDRPAGEREQPEDAPALRPVAGEAGDHEVGRTSRSGWRRTARAGPRAAPRRRAAGRATGRRRGRARTPVGRSPSIAWTSSASSDRSNGAIAIRAARDLAAVVSARVRAERMVAGQLVGLPRPDEAHAVGPADPAQERDERAGAGIRVVEVLEDEEHGLPLGQPADDAEEPLEHAALASLERGRSSAVPEGARVASRPRPRGTAGRRPRRPARRGRTSSASSMSRKTGRRARTIGPYGSSAPGPVGSAADHGERLVRPPTRRATSSTNRLTPTPPGPSISTAVASPPDAASRAGASRMNAASRPTNRALSIVAGMSRILGADSRPDVPVAEDRTLPATLGGASRHPPSVLRRGGPPRPPATSRPAGRHRR